MKYVQIVSLLLSALILMASAVIFVNYINSAGDHVNNTFVGFAFGGTSVEQAKILIDRTKTYTNLFILDCGINLISLNESAVKEVCNYAVNAGLHIIINLGTRTLQNWEWQLRFLNDSKHMYGDKFLGAYYDDEPIGIPFDWNWSEYWQEYFLNSSSTFSRSSLLPIYDKLQEARLTGQYPQDYNQEANWYNLLLSRNRGHVDLKNSNITTFTSDYLLYWYSYLGGYDVMFAQVGWNLNLEQQIAEVRGAAKLQNKEWGTIITWKYNEPPFLDTAENVYQQMVSSYNAGARYITIFNYPYNNSENPFGILTDEHFQAVERFWNKIITKTAPNSNNAEAVLILPKNYGFGLRKVNDKIWGFWGPDDKSLLIWNNSQILLDRYGLNLDIVYDDARYPIMGNYSKVYLWNQTVT